jgi:hypothetical protein
MYTSTFFQFPNKINRQFWMSQIHLRTWISISVMPHNSDQINLAIQTSTFKITITNGYNSWNSYLHQSHLFSAFSFTFEFIFLKYNMDCRFQIHFCFYIRSKTTFRHLHIKSVLFYSLFIQIPYIWTSCFLYNFNYKF